MIALSDGLTFSEGSINNYGFIRQNFDGDNDIDVPFGQRSREARGAVLELRVRGGLVFHDELLPFHPAEGTQNGNDNGFAWGIGLGAFAFMGLVIGVTVASASQNQSFSQH